MTEALRFDLWDLLHDLSLDLSAKLTSEALFFKFKDTESDLDESKNLILMRCCALIASRSIKMQSIDGGEIQGNSISISTFLKGTPTELNSYLNFLEKLLPHTSPDLLIIIQDLIRKTEISTITYNKFKDIWEKVGIRGCDGIISSTMQMLWLLIINLKKSLNIQSIYESGYLMIGVYDIALRNLDEHSLGLSPPFLHPLCSILKAGAEQAVAWVSRIEAQVADFLLKGSLCSKNTTINGVFSHSVLNRNISLLSEAYQSSLSQEDFDERDLILLKQKIRTPQKPRCLRVNKPHEIIGKVLRWDENTVGPSIASKLHEVSLPPPSPFIPPPTPMTMAMELNNWFIELIDNSINPLEHIIKLAPVHAFNIFRLRTNDILASTRKVFEQRNIGNRSSLGMQFINDNFEPQLLIRPQTDENNTKIEELSKFYYIVISRVLNKELEKHNSVEEILINEDLQRGLYSCCLEALLYLHSVVSINFEEVLDISGASAFDFWKVISSFSQFDQNVPQSLRRHFREIEVKIISSLSWKSGSKINKAVKALIATSENSTDTNLFLKRLLSHCANRILELSNSLGLSEAVKEEIWAAFKYLLSEKTELLENRHVDHMVICTIYGVCKIHSVVTFKVLVEKYRQLYLEDVNFFKKVYLEDDTYDDIIMFYNVVYIQTMKDFLTHKVSASKPRIEVLHPDSPLRANIPIQAIGSGILANIMKSPMKSPFRTPRSEILWAPNESFSPLPKLNVNKRLDFGNELPSKKIKIIADILTVREEDIGPAPSLKKDTNL